MMYADTQRGLTLSELKARFNYDPATGLFTYKQGQKRKAGKVAGNTSTGYINICINYKSYYAHRLAWFYCHGTWPPEQLDHIDGNRLNNRISNLRLATNRQNMHHIGKTKVANGLPKGVFRTPKGRFGAKMTMMNKQVYLGYFDNPTDAGEAYKQVSLKYHGKFSPFR